MTAYFPESLAAADPSAPAYLPQNHDGDSSLLMRLPLSNASTAPLQGLSGSLMSPTWGLPLPLWRISLSSSQMLLHVPLAHFPSSQWQPSSLNIITPFTRPCCISQSFRLVGGPLLFCAAAGLGHRSGCRFGPWWGYCWMVAVHACARGHPGLMACW